jgi:hypothetical protein
MFCPTQVGYFNKVQRASFGYHLSLKPLMNTLKKNLTLAILTAKLLLKDDLVKELVEGNAR